MLGAEDFTPGGFGWVAWAAIIVAVAAFVLPAINGIITRWRQGGWGAMLEERSKCHFCGSRLKYESLASPAKKGICRACGRVQPWAEKRPT